MRRSMSSSRSGASLMTSSMHTSVTGNTASNNKDKLVKKSRTVQTFLTKDPVTDRDYSENEGHVNFEVSMIDFILNVVS